jgi:hypothetical protein
MVPEKQIEDPGAATRVEIELTPNEGSRPWRRRSDASPTVQLSGNDVASDASGAAPEFETQLPGDDARPQPVDRRRLVVAGSVIAVVALFVGWALGRAGESPAGEAQPSPNTTEPSGLETLAPAVVPSTVPATTRPVVRAGPTTTTPAQWETTTIDVAAAAAALDIRVVIVGGGSIAEIDTGSGEMRSLTTRISFSQPPLVNAGADWILIRNLDSGQSQHIRSGELPVAVNVGDAWSTFFQRDTGLFWRFSPMFTASEPTDVVEIDAEGNETGRAFPIPAGVWPQAGDPAGGLVVGAPGGTYQVGPDGARRLTTGTLIALSPRIAVVTDCGEDFSDCGLFVLDRASEQRTELDPGVTEAGDPTGIFDLQNAGFWGSPELMGAVSPDDRWAPVMMAGTSQQFGLLDLTTGDFVPVAPDPPSSLWWSPDGRIAIYNQNGRLRLFDTEQRTSTDVVEPGSVSAAAFTVRP